MKKYFDGLTYLAIRLTGFVIVFLPVIYAINHWAGFKLALKIQHGSSIEIPDDLTGLIAVEVMLLVFLLVMAGLRKIFLREKRSDRFKMTRNWKARQLLDLTWDIAARSVNQVPLKSPLKDLENAFGKPASTTATKLSYPAFGLEIFIGEQTDTVAVFLFHIQGDEAFKSCPLKARLNDGEWHVFSSRDTVELIHSFLGTPVKTDSLKDGTSETYVWEDVKIQVFYTIRGTVNLILFLNV